MGNLRTAVWSAISALFSKKGGGGVAALVPPLMSGRPAPWAADPAEQVLHLRHWVYAAVRAVAGAVASQRLRFYAAKGSGRVELDDHAAARLFRRVNPFHTRWWLMSSTVTYLELTGNAYWWVPSNALGAPAEIWLMPSQRVRVVPDERDFIGEYVYRLGSREVRFAPGEVVHFRYPNPGSDFYGAGPLQAAAESVDAHESLKVAQANSFAGGAFPGLILRAERPLDADAVKRLEARIRDHYGTSEKAGRVLLLEEGLTASPLSFSPKEMDFLSSGRVTRDEILGVFGVPAAIAGLAEDVNRASAAALNEIFARWTVRPKLEMIAGAVNQDLCPRFDPGLECEFDDPVPADRSADRADMLARVNSGVTTVNEERARLGLEPVEWGDVPAGGPSGAGTGPAAAPEKALARKEDR